MKRSLIKLVHSLGQSLKVKCFWNILVARVLNYLLLVIKACSYEDSLLWRNFYEAIKIDFVSDEPRKTHKKKKTKMSVSLTWNKIFKKENCQFWNWNKQWLHDRVTEKLNKEIVYLIPLFCICHWCNMYNKLYFTFTTNTDSTVNLLLQAFILGFVYIRSH